MILTQNSLDDLNNHLEADVGKVTSLQFRPNLVVSGSEIKPYDEDKWEWIKIGNKVVMKGFKPCTR